MVDEEVIAEVVSKMTGIPDFTRMTETEDSLHLMQMEDELHKRVISQDEAIKAVARAVRRSRGGIKDPKRPTGTFIFLARPAWARPYLQRLAEFMFGDEDALVQIDMSEYMEKHNVTRGRSAHRPDTSATKKAANSPSSRRRPTGSCCSTKSRRPTLRS